MCLYPRLIKNRKYTVNKKNGGNVPPITDDRVKYIAAGCQKCIECRKQKKREWQLRLLEDIKTNKNGKFITLTFNNEAILELWSYIKANFKEQYIGYDLDNQIATIAMHLFRERWRKQFKHSPRHWFITELGHTGTENIHLHGIIWTDLPILHTDILEKTWKYGYIWKGNKKYGQIENYVSAKTINYIIKYVHKADFEHPNYRPIVLTSPGIGKNYTDTYNAKKNKYKGEETNTTYKTETGHKIALPIYWRNKIYTEEEREKLWLQQLDKETRYVMGEKINVKNGDYKEYDLAIKHYRDLNTKLGYGSDQLNYEQALYEMERRIIIQKTRIAKAQKKKNKNASGGI